MLDLFVAISLCLLITGLFLTADVNFISKGSLKSVFAEKNIDVFSPYFPNVGLKIEGVNGAGRGSSIKSTMMQERAKSQQRLWMSAYSTQI